MSAGNEFQLVKIETHVLKVQIHCQGCARKVMRVLKKIEGVYGVSIDAYRQKVKVSGTVDCATLIAKLMKSGKHAELWASGHKQNKRLPVLANLPMDDYNHYPIQGPINGFGASNNQPMMSPVFDRGFADLGCESYLNKSAGIESLMGHNNFKATTMEDIPPFLWDGNTVANAHSPEGNIRSILGLQDFANNAGGFAGIEHAEFARLPNLQTGIPSYGRHYSPSAMMNNMKQYQYNLPSPTTMRTDLPDLCAFQNMNIPVHENTLMLQHQGNMNPDFCSFQNYPVHGNTPMLQHQRTMNPMINRIPPVIYHGWN